MLSAPTAYVHNIFCEAVISKRTQRGLRASSVDQLLRLYCNYLSYLSATTEFNWRCLRPYPATTATPFRLYCVFIITPSHGANCVHAQSNRRRMAILAPLPRPVKMHTAAVLCRCWRFYRAHFCVLHFLGMQQDRPMNAALV